MYSVCKHDTRRPEEGVGSPEIRVTDSCEHPGRHWKLNLGLLKEKQVLLTTKSSLHPPSCILRLS